MDTPRLPFKIPIKNGRLRSTDCWPGDIRHTSQRRPDPRRSTFFCGIVFRAPPTTSAGKNQGRLHMAGTWAPLEWPLCVSIFKEKMAVCGVGRAEKLVIRHVEKNFPKRDTHGKSFGHSTEKIWFLRRNRLSCSPIWKSTVIELSKNGAKWQADKREKQVLPAGLGTKKQSKVSSFAISRHTQHTRVFIFQRDTKHFEQSTV